jgi:hypothetical protein
LSAECLHLVDVVTCHPAACYRVFTPNVLQAAEEHRREARAAAQGGRWA